MKASEARVADLRARLAAAETALDEEHTALESDQALAECLMDPNLVITRQVWGLRRQMSWQSCLIPGTPYL